MKLEILKKLIALANNNPNEHEANTAARRVCKALIVDKYIEQLHDSSTTYTYTTKPPNPPGGRTPYDDLQDIVREAKRQQEAQARRQYDYETKGTWYTEPRNWDDSPFGDQWTNPFRENKKQRNLEKDILQVRQMSWKKERYNRAENSYYNPEMMRTFTVSFFKHWETVYGKPHPEDKGETGQSERERKGFKWNKQQKRWERLLKCKTCGKKKQTIFEGAPEVFECNNCVWNAYNKERETEKKKASPVICHLTGKPCGTPITCVGNGCSWKI